MRATAGIVLGIAMWWALFLLSTFLIVVVWSTTKEFRQAVFELGDYSVAPTTMLATFLVMYIPIGLVSGFLTTAVTRKRWHTWIVAVPIVAFAIFQHLFTLWDNLPAWYNLAVVVVIAPFTIVGGRLPRSADRDAVLGRPAAP